MNNDDIEDRKYRVVLNDEEQYSIWDAGRPNPGGWRDAPKIGSKSECLAYIKGVWIDMRPLSLRIKMEKAGSAPDHSDVYLNGNNGKASGT
jgi:MbtH protein